MYPRPLWLAASVADFDLSCTWDTIPGKMPDVRREATAMADGSGKKDDGKGGAVCATCGKRAQLPYWCEVCGRAVAEKRCPYCGLKARKIR